MTSVPSPENPPPFVWAIGSLPPPVTGMSLLTEKVVERLREKAPLRVSNFSVGDDRPRPHTRVLRMLRTAWCVAQLVFHGSEQKGRLYIAANSRGGLVMTNLLVKAGRHLGYKIYLHHHVYYYIDAFDERMARIDRNMRASDVHVVHCPQMQDDFCARYQSKCQFESLYPSIVSLPLSRPRTDQHKPFCLGFLANLNVAKGLDRVLDTFRMLAERRSDVHLCLAGPAATTEAKHLIAAAIAEHQGRISYIGPVFGQQKLEFFNSIDCFLFPSRSESWGIVLNESLAAGVPVVTTDHGCIRTLVGNRAGIAIRDEANYAAHAVRQIETWIDSPDTFREASAAAIEQACALHRTAAEQLEHLTTKICSPTEE